MASVPDLVCKRGFVFFLLTAASAFAQFRTDYSVQDRTWTLGNGVVQAEFQLHPDGVFTFQQLTNLRTSRVWAPPEGVRSSPIQLEVSGTVINEHSHFTLVHQFAEEIPRQGVRQTILLQEAVTLGHILLELELFRGQPAIRYRVSYTNRSGAPQRIGFANVLPWTFATNGRVFRLFRVKQWSNYGRDGNFEPEQSFLIAGREPVQMNTGAHGTYCAWLALRDERNAGLFAGWEFDGRLTALASRRTNPARIELSAPLTEVDRPLESGETFASPAAFLGVFRGNWDDAGYRTQRFVEAAIAPPIPDNGFPYVMWDSWGYQLNFDEATLRANAEIAARIGIEVFVLDLGWARNIGDWRPDPRKFPNGLRPLSDYVHSLGMKFGLHFAFAEADPAAPVLVSNPNWRSSSTYGYFGAVSLCLSHRPVREWVLAETIRMIDEYNVDWILQDGENMVKHCDKSSHTHAPADSNYANAVDGLNWVVENAQRQRPDVLWENCEDGGNMMTYKMARNYVTSIAADDSGEITTRQAIYGITYPFPPRYSDRYMPHDEFDPYITRSYMFGGPWIWMNRLPQVSEQRLQVAEQEIRLFKQLRARLRAGKVLHLSERPTGQSVDAIGSHHIPTDTVIAFVFRPEIPDESYTLRIDTLGPARMYRVRFQESGRAATMSGTDIAGGIHVELPHPWFAEIIYIEPEDATQ